MNWLLTLWLTVANFGQVAANNQQKEIGWLVDSVRHVVWVSIKTELYRCENTKYSNAFDQVNQIIKQGKLKDSAGAIENDVWALALSVCQLVGNR